jgi:hypothetical protein
MNVEIYSYSLFTTVLGMLVVFLSLATLSVMMVVLKAAFASTEKRDGRNGRRKAAVRGRQVQEPVREPPPWLMAAAAAYLAEEQGEPDRPTAEPWNAEVNHYDPWFSAGKSLRRGV